eukprot:4008765-Alexandrium_andersonii.AAC.1
MRKLGTIQHFKLGGAGCPVNIGWACVARHPGGRRQLTNGPALSIPFVPPILQMGRPVQIQTVARVWEATIK